MCGYVGNAENKRLRKPTKRLLESAEEYEKIFAASKKSKRSPSETSCLVRPYFSYHRGTAQPSAQSWMFPVCPPQIAFGSYLHAQQTSGTTPPRHLGTTHEAVTSTTSPVGALEASSEQRPSEDEFSSAASSESPGATQPPPNTDPEPHLTPETGK